MYKLSPVHVLQNIGVIILTKDIIAFKGTVYDNQYNGGGILLTYLIIDEVFRGGQISGDSIVLIGDEFEADCSVNVHWRIELDQQYYIACYSDEPANVVANNLAPSGISNFAPFLCAMTYLRIEDVNVKVEWYQILRNNTPRMY
ncbi:MAG: hypothetical protein ACI86M_003831 [Saprospiraceae bacterium]